MFECHSYRRDTSDLGMHKDKAEQMKKRQWKAQAWKVPPFKKKGEEDTPGRQREMEEWKKYESGKFPFCNNLKSIHKKKEMKECRSRVRNLRKVQKTWGKNVRIVTWLGCNTTQQRGPPNTEARISGGMRDVMTSPATQVAWEYNKHGQ